MDPFTGSDSLGVFLTSGNAVGDCLGGDLCQIEFDGIYPYIKFCGMGKMRVQQLCQNVEILEMNITLSDAGVITTVVNDRLGGEYTGTTTLTAYDEPLMCSAGVYWARVIFESQYSALNTTGTVTIAGQIGLNNAVSMENTDVADHDSVAGLEQYHCLWFYARDDMVIDNILLPNSLGALSTTHGFLGTPTTAPTTEVIADRFTEPTGAVWQTGSWDCAQSLTEGEYIPFWIKRTNMNDGGWMICGIYVTFTVGSDQYTINLFGVSYIKEDALAEYRLYCDDTGGTVGGSLVATSTTLPFNYDITPPTLTDKTWRFRLGERNAYGAESLEMLLEHVVTLGVVDSVVVDLTGPDAVTSLVLTGAGGGYVCRNFCRL